MTTLGIVGIFNAINYDKNQHIAYSNDIKYPKLYVEKNLKNKGHKLKER